MLVGSLISKDWQVSWKDQAKKELELGVLIVFHIN
jgi:hypothetical protein